MVQSLIYCSEQIEIPETFPNILKTYAKAAIRTQPHDLLRWSAEYFRCLSLNQSPPAKTRLEIDVGSGILTKGLLKILLVQVGRGFYICREILQKRWQGLGLPEDELFKYLSVCRMLSWPQVHWLRLFAIMVGSINQEPTDSMTMLCELLTDDNEGGRARVPFWMFGVCYKILAEIDCGEEQEFCNGRKKLPNGDLEPEVPMSDYPKVFSAASFQESLMEEYMKMLELRSPNSTANMEESSPTVTPSCSRATLKEADSSATSSFKPFETSPLDRKRLLYQSDDFDSIILMLRESRGAKLHNYEGPHYINETNIQHARERARAAEIMETRECQALLIKESNVKLSENEQFKLLNYLGPPWSFIHKFTTDNCRDRSFNFIEIDSIPSDADVTPTLASDESFDFRKKKPLSVAHSDSNSLTSETSSENLNRVLIEELSPHLESQTYLLSLEHVERLFSSAESQGHIKASDTESILSFLQQDEEHDLKIAGEKNYQNIFSIDVMMEVLQQSKKENITFETLDDVIKYLKKECYKFEVCKKRTSEEKSEWEDTQINESNSGETRHESTSGRESESRCENEKSENHQNIIPYDTEKRSSTSQSLNRSADNYLNSKILNCDISDRVNSGLGLVAESSKTSISLNNLRTKGNGSDISSIFDHCVCELRHPYQDEIGLRELNGGSDEFNCKITILPGIGPTVSEKTISDFLCYLKCRSMNQNGMIMPKNFKEDNCPKISD